jgi:hypothetical protein
MNAFEAGDKRLANWVGVSTVNAMNYYYPYKSLHRCEVIKLTGESFRLRNRKTIFGKPRLKL